MGARPVLFNIEENEVERWVKSEMIKFAGITKLFKTSRMRTN